MQSGTCASNGFVSLDDEAECIADFGLTRGLPQVRDLLPESGSAPGAAPTNLGGVLRRALGEGPAAD